MTDKDEGFLSRWSRRKTLPDDSEQENQQAEKDIKHDLVESDDAKVTESELPVWQQDNVDVEIKQKALSALFKQPEFNDVDHLNEYDEDFTRFSGLGDIVTQEMKRMIRLAEEKTRPEPDTEKTQDIVNSPVEINNDKDNEDDKLA